MDVLRPLGELSLSKNAMESEMKSESHGNQCTKNIESRQDDFHHHGLLFNLDINGSHRLR